MLSCRAVSAPLFLANLVLTVVLLVLAAAAGFRRARRAHYALVAATTLSLVLAIVQAEMFGRGYVFAPERLRIHLTCAFAALACLPGVAWSGLGLARGRRPRRVHRRWVSAFALLVLAAVASAAWMFGNAEPRV